MLCRLNRLLNLSLELVHTRAYIPLGRAGCSLQPKIIDLREDAVLTGHPAVAEFFPLVLASDPIGFLADSREQLLDSFVQRCRGIIFEFGNGVGHLSFIVCAALTGALHLLLNLIPALTRWAK